MMQSQHKVGEVTARRGSLSSSHRDHCRLRDWGRGRAQLSPSFCAPPSELCLILWPNSLVESQSPLCGGKAIAPPRPAALCPAGAGP